MALFDRVHNYLGLVRFSHTIFALPFALASMLVAAGGLPAWPLIGWILVCMVSARTAAMTFNRIVDREIDALNPRTQSRHLPRGAVSLFEAIGLWLVSSALFFWGAWSLNSLAFVLSPLAFIVINGYSYFKRFSWLSHFVLGLSLAIAPVGAWIGVQGNVSLASLLLAAGVLLWVAGFDIIYALMDEEFDKTQGLHSLVVRCGKKNALRIAFALHGLCIVFIAFFGYASHLGWIYFGGITIFAGLIIYEHSIVSPEDVSRVNTAFFTVNGAISLGVLVCTILDMMG
ncbi:MAG: UbiA-like polyprenyltransferase [bacterium]|jgi:4-hydroxybenzoate polyprenyltransferase|nr:UbiA-like polyprenyltransferase [bacterium]